MRPARPPAQHSASHGAGSQRTAVGTRKVARRGRRTAWATGPERGQRAGPGRGSDAGLWRCPMRQPHEGVVCSPRSHTRKLRLGADWPPSFRAGPRFCAAPAPPPCTPCIRGHPLPAADVVFTLLVTISGTGIWANTAVRHKRDLLKKEVLEERPSLPGKGHEKKRSLLFPWTVSRRVQCLEALRPSCYKLRAAQTWWAAEQRDAPPGPANPGGFYG